MTALVTTDGFVFYEQADGTYSDGDVTYTATEIARNGYGS